MNVPYIPTSLFKFGIKPLSAGTERVYNTDKGRGLHLVGFDVETINRELFRSNDLYSVQLVADSHENEHLFYCKEQGTQNLDMFFTATGTIFKKSACLRSR